MYQVTKRFVSGLLSGIVVTELTSVKYVVGKKYSACAGSSDYVVESIEENAICNYCEGVGSFPVDHDELPCDHCKGKGVRS